MSPSWRVLTLRYNPLTRTETVVARSGAMEYEAALAFRALRARTLHRQAGCPEEWEAVAVSRGCAVRPECPGLGIDPIGVSGDGGLRVVVDLL